MMLLGLSQRQTAKLAGISQGHLSQVYSGERPDYGLLDRLWSMLEQWTTPAEAEAAYLSLIERERIEAEAQAEAATETR